MLFSEKVKAVRAKLLISQNELAKSIGVSFATINRWESKGIEPLFLTMKKFEQFCEKNNIKFEE